MVSTINRNRGLLESNQVNTNRIVRSGQLLFFRYAWPCNQANYGTRVDRNPQRVAKLHRYSLQITLSEKEVLEMGTLLQQCFPVAFAEMMDIVSFCMDRIWPVDQVRNFWRNHHSGRGESGTVAGDACRVREMIVTGFRPVELCLEGTMHTLNTVIAVPIGGRREELLIDQYLLQPKIGEHIFPHQFTVCEVDNVQSGAGELESRGSEVIRPQELPTEPLVTAPQSQPTSCRSLVDEEDPGDVLIGVPSTVLPPITQTHCDCGRECKGGQCKHDAPLYIQTGVPEPEGVEEVMYGNHFDGNPS